MTFFFEPPSYALHLYIKYNLLEQGVKKAEEGKKENQKRKTGKEGRKKERGKDPFVAVSKRSWFKERPET
jgi:replication initiation and membrane attachment protein DnaB